MRRSGEFITVGGNAKLNKLGGWGDHLSRLAKIAEQQGTKAQAYLSSDANKELVDITVKKLGKENVVILPKK